MRVASDIEYLVLGQNQTEGSRKEFLK